METLEKFMKSDVYAKVVMLMNRRDYFKMAKSKAFFICCLKELTNPKDKILKHFSKEKKDKIIRKAKAILKDKKKLDCFLRNLK